MNAQPQATTLNVTTYAGNGVYQYERVITTVYALGHEHLDALEAVVNGKRIAVDFVAEFERVGVLEAGELTALGMEVVREAGLEPANGVQNLVATVPVYEAAADALPAELPEPLEVLRAGAFVHVTPLYGKRPYFGWVKSVDGDRVTVSHWSFGYLCEHSIEEVRLHLSAEAAAL